MAAKNSGPICCASRLPLGLEKAKVEGPLGSEWLLVGGFSDKEVTG